MDLKFIFRALRYRNYRLFFSGQSISLVGTWMQQMAVSWLVYRLTHSAFLLGIVGFVGQIPTFLFAPLAGVIADRHNRHRLLLLTQTMAMLQACSLSWVVITGAVQFWHIVALSFCAGLINALDIPVRQAFTIDMIEEKADLSNAIALNSSMVNMAKLIGPALAGFVIAIVGETPCFVFNAVSYLAVIAALLAMKVSHKGPENVGPDIISQLKEGFIYASDFVPIRIILLLLCLVSLVGGGFQTIIPVFAKDVFDGGPKVLGFIMAASGFGAFSGAIYLASRKSVLGLVRVIPWMAGLFGTCVFLFAMSPYLWLSIVLAFFAGFGIMVQMAASNTVLQMVVDEDKRGRVMSFYTMAFMGTAPIGSLLVGVFAEKWGVHRTLLTGGVFCVAGAMLFRTQLSVLRQHIRPIYIRKGIIPQVAEGLGAATVIK